MYINIIIYDQLIGVIITSNTSTSLSFYTNLKNGCISISFCKISYKLKSIDLVFLF